MADAASFFASKKKKKAFKFNANKIDSSSVTSTVHVDAPALSNYTDGPVSGVTSLSAVPVLGSSDPKHGGNSHDDGNDQWDDEALAAATTRKAPVPTSAGAATSRDLVVDVKALDLKGSYNDEQDIAERLRVQETRAQLAAAREGMEREAQRIKEEKEKKELAASNRFGAAAAAGMSGSGDGGAAAGGKWVPSRLRAGGSSMTTAERFGMGGLSSSSSQRVNTEDENLFPDLAAAEAIIEKQKQEQPAFMAPKKTPVGGGATWGSRPKLNLKPKTTHAAAEESQESASNDQAEEPAVTATDVPSAAASAETDEKAAVAVPVVEEPVKEVVATGTTDKAATDDTAIADVLNNTTASAVAPIKPKKKKKKDLSTFKK